MFKLKYTLKFYLGAVLFIFSLILGKITLTTFIVYYKISWIRWLSLIVYIISWPMLIIGVWWVGKEYAKALNKYFSYKFYHKSLKSGTQKAYHKTKAGTQRAYHRTKTGTKNAYHKGKDRTRKAYHKGREVHSKVKERSKRAVNKGKEVHSKVKERSRNAYHKSKEVHSKVKNKLKRKKV